jgi:hypothetical protein
MFEHSKSPVVPDHIRDELRDFEWPPSWKPIEPAINDELRREVGRGHVLYRRDAVAVARATNADDVLFWLPDGPAAFAEVHLTWTGRRESRPEWPWTRLFASFTAWVEQSLREAPDDFLVAEHLDSSAFPCCPNQDPYPYKCTDCGLPLVLCRECDTLYDRLPNTSHYGEVNSFDPTRPSHHCPRCGHAFEYSFMTNQKYRLTLTEWRAAGLEQLLK